MIPQHLPNSHQNEVFKTLTSYHLLIAVDFDEIIVIPLGFAVYGAIPQITKIN